MCLTVLIFVWLNQNGSLLYFSMFLIDKSFRVEFQALAQIYLVDDFQELVLYVGSSRDPAGIL